MTTDDPAFYCVSIYITDRSWGGPEEGGWWYSVGEPALELGHYTSIFTTLDEAIECRDALRERIIPTLNEGRRDINSVLCDGVYDAVIDEGHYPTPYPKERPHYE